MVDAQQPGDLRSDGPQHLRLERVARRESGDPPQRRALADETLKLVDAISRLAHLGARAYAASVPSPAVTAIERSRRSASRSIWRLRSAAIPSRSPISA
jgi:hypothetical protein